MWTTSRTPSLTVVCVGLCGQVQKSPVLSVTVVCVGLCGQEEKEKLESGAAYQEKEDLIRRLNKEVSEMRSNLSKLERELAKAKEVISAQGSKLRLLDHEKHNMHVKFKDELARATQTMRHEVEKMREVSQLFVRHRVGASVGSSAWLSLWAFDRQFGPVLI